MAEEHRRRSRPAELAKGLSTASGLLGLSGGRSDDTRDPAADLALRVFTHHATRALAAAATSLDALVFTGEIGWDQPELRTAITRGLRLLGISQVPTVDLHEDGPLTPTDATTQVLVVQPREELQLCATTMATINPG